MYLSSFLFTGQRWTGAYVGLSGCLAFVLVESADQNGAGAGATARSIVGYTLATLDSTRFYPKLVSEWLPAQAVQYTQPSGDPSGWSEEEKAIEELYVTLCTLHR